jgi:5-deoxy-D-glucuronate isomerase
MIGTHVYIKFGVHHGKKGKVLKETTKQGELAFVLLVDGQHIIKKQKNTVKMLPVNK